VPKVPRSHKCVPRVAVKTITLCLIFAFVVGVTPLAGAQESGTVPDPAANGPTNFGYGAASVLLTIPYGVAKVLYAAVGSVVGGAALVFSAGDTKAAKAVWNASLHGTYVLTPEHIKGEKDIHFVGVSEDTSAQTAGAKVAGPAPTLGSEGDAPQIFDEPANDVGHADRRRDDDKIRDNPAFNVHSREKGQ